MLRSHPATSFPLPSRPVSRSDSNPDTAQTPVPVPGWHGTVTPELLRTVSGGFFRHCSTFWSFCILKVYNSSHLMDFTGCVPAGAYPQYTSSPQRVSISGTGTVVGTTVPVIVPLSVLPPGVVKNLCILLPEQIRYTIPSGSGWAVSYRKNTSLI